MPGLSATFRRSRQSMMRWRWVMIGLGGLLALVLLANGNYVIGGVLAALLVARAGDDHADATHVERTGARRCSRSGATARSRLRIRHGSGATTNNPMILGVWRTRFASVRGSRDRRRRLRLLGGALQERAARFGV